jgi:hypothetical protein
MFLRGKEGRAGIEILQSKDEDDRFEAKEALPPRIPGGDPLSHPQVDVSQQNQPGKKIFSFPHDLLGFFESLRLYDRALAQYLDRGGWLAWGLVPTNEDFKPETADSLWRRFQAQVTQLAGDMHRGLKDILAQSLLTPACGTGYMSREDGRRVLTTLRELGIRGQEWLAAL